MPSGYEQSPDYGGPAPTRRGIVLAVIAVIAAAIVIVLSVAAARADEHWSAVAIAPDGYWFATMDKYSQGDARKIVSNDCRENSSQPEECIVSVVKNAESAVAWQCFSPEGRSITLITSGYEYDEIDDHIPDMTGAVRSKGYKPDDCKPLVFLNGFEGHKL